MGYTHYWSTSLQADPAKLDEVGADIAKLIENTDIPLGDGHGHFGSKPSHENGVIMFNGIDASQDGGDDLAHETFVWPPGAFAVSEHDPGWNFEFCKTARKPYDSVVAACLIRAKKVLGDDIKVSSDGYSNEFLEGSGDYYGPVESASSLYERTFGEPAFSPLEKDEEE